MTTGPTRRRATLVGALVGTAAVALAACTASPAQVAQQQGGSGGVPLTVQGDAGNPTLIENFNPLSPGVLGGTRWMYEPLEVPSTVDGTFTPFLATKHSFTDAKTLVFTIRQGVKWSDGQAFSAQDVAFTFDLLKKYPAADTTGVWTQVESVEASGDTFTVHFKSPNVPFAATVAQVPIVPQHVFASVGDPTKYTNTKPVVTGPFVLDSFAPTQYQLKKNTGYWQADKIAPPEVVFPAQSTNQSTNQLDVTSGKYDWSYNYLPDVKNTYVAKDPAHNAYWFPPGGVIGLYLNLTKAPYSDVSFRQGISLALDRKTIADKAVNGYLGAASQSGIILPNEQKWLDSSLPDEGQVTQDASAATAAFAKAGYTMQGGKLVGKDGKQASMTIVLPANFSDWVSAATEVVTELKAVGINASTETPQYAQYSTEIQGGSFDAAIGGFGGSGVPYTDFNNALNSSFATPVGTATINNFQRFKDAGADSALATLAQATGEDQQKQATNALQQVMVEKLPVVLMYYGGSWGIFSTKNYTGWPSADNPYTLPTPYNDAVLLVVTHLKKAS